MGEEDDVQKALAFLRKHDVSCTGAAPVAQTHLTSLDIEDINNGVDDGAVSGGHQPLGPNWKKPGAYAQLPKIANHPDTAWLMHERQDKSGKYKTWMFFSKMTGDYYRVNDAGNGYEPMNAPHNPWAAPVIVRAGNASILTAEGVKLDMAVLLPDLQRTGFLLKQPLEFLDTPASLFVLCAGLRNTNMAAEFCAKRLHSAVLPKLSSRATVWYDYELIELLTQATMGLDKQLLESSACFAGCSLAVALLIGCRLIVASLGSARCLVCHPGAAPEPKRSGSAPVPGGTAALPWTTKRVAGSGMHTVANKEEAMRVETDTAGLYRAPVDGSSDDSKLYGRSALPSAIAATADEWERECLRVTRAVNSFAVLGLTPKEVQEGAASIRKSFRRQSLIVHPDKVSDERRQRTTDVFSKLQAAVEAVESMLETDAAATVLLASVHCAHDEGRLAADSAVACKLLAVPEGCTAGQASKAAKEKFHSPLSKLQNTSRLDVERALKILEVAEESAARGTQLWLPAEADVAMQVTRALGCKDLKSPVKHLSTELTVEIVQLELGEVSGLALIAEGAEGLTDTMVARRVAEHAPGRPRAAALRIAIDGAKIASRQKGGSRKTISAVCAFFRGDSSASDSLATAHPAKRMKTGPPERVRVSHVLLRWAGLKDGDQFARPGLPAPKRTQADAERELLELAEGLLMARDPETLGARFKAVVLERSECSTALNVPHADLGWLDPGGGEPSFEAAAFDTPLGGLSDVVVTSRGAHLMYRLG